MKKGILLLFLLVGCSDNAAQIRHNELMDSMDRQEYQAKLSEMRALEEQMRANKRNSQAELDRLRKMQQDGDIDGIMQTARRYGE